MKLLKKVFIAGAITMVALVATPKMMPGMQVNATSIKLSATKKTMYKGYTYKLKVTGTSKKVTWTSSDKSKASVNSKGKVYVKKNGKVTITAKVGSKKLKCKVTIKNKPYKLVQFKNDTFYDLKDVAKKYKYLGDIKNYAEYKYDLDEDGKKDTIKVKAQKNDGDDYVSGYTVKLNGKEFYKTESIGERLCIVDLNKNDKKIEVLIGGESAQFGNMPFTVYQKNKTKIKKIGKIDFDDDTIKINKKGKIVSRNHIERLITPYFVKQYYNLSNGKIKTKKLSFKNVGNVTFKAKYIIAFEKNKKDIVDFGVGDAPNEIPEGTKFKVLELSKNYAGCQIIYIKLNNGKTGYIYNITGV